MNVEDFIDHVTECVGDIDAVVVAQEGQIDAPEGWVLIGTEVIAGKRIRIFELSEEN